MLSLSADITESDVDLKMINGHSAGSTDDIEHGNQLMKFAEAFASRDQELLESARADLLQSAGPEVLVDATGVAANFQRMVRIADSTGIPLDERSAALSAGVARELDLKRFESAKNTPPGGLKRKLLSVIARPMAKRMFKKLSEKSA